jgi:hypothetical protein
MLDDLGDYLNFKGFESQEELDSIKRKCQERYGPRPWNESRQKGVPPLTPILGEANEAKLTKQIEQYLFFEG